MAKNVVKRDGTNEMRVASHGVSRTTSFQSSTQMLLVSSSSSLECQYSAS